jgi:hypothetical protein
MKASIVILLTAALFCSQQNLSAYECMLPGELCFPSVTSENNASSTNENKMSVTVSIRPVNEEKWRIIHAQEIARQLFVLVEKSNLIVPGKSEAQLRDEVSKLAKEKFGVDQHWHKKIVRSGVNTTAIYPDDPPDRILQEDDILFIDFGIVVDGWESDYAKTYVLGNDPLKIKLKNDVEKAWYDTYAWYHRQTKVKSSDLFQFVSDRAKQNGWKFGGEIAGHIVGKYPHEQPLDPKSLELDVHPTNHNDMFLLDAQGNKRSWILEIHFVDKKNNIGAYMEQLIQ